VSFRVVRDEHAFQRANRTEESAPLLSVIVNLNLGGADSSLGVNDTLKRVILVYTISENGLSGSYVGVP